MEALPAGPGISCESLGRRLAWLNPATWSSDESATTTAINAASWLWLLGAGLARFADLNSQSSARPTA
jgi:hypothetical protein